AMIVVARSLSGVTIVDRSGTPTEHVPCTFALSVFERRAFDLIRRCRRSPEELVGKRQGRPRHFFGHAPISIAHFAIGKALSIPKSRYATQSDDLLSPFG